MREMHIHFLLSHKGRGAGQLCLHTLRHTCTPPFHQQWGLETNLSYAHLPYCWKSRLFSHLFEIARDAKMYTHISQGPGNDISEIWSSSLCRKKVLVDQNVVERKFLR